MTKIRFEGETPRHIDHKAMRLQLLNGLDLVRTQIMFGFNETVKSWEHDVKFKAVGTKSGISLAGGVPTVTVETDDDIYRFVSEGTQPHVITPNGDYPLFFHSEYAAKTAPGVIDSWEGGAGERDTLRDMVEHPGIEHPRHFDQAIGATLQDFFLATMEQAMQRAARASGYSVR